MGNTLSASILETFAPVDRDKIREKLREEFKEFDYKIIVLDDDPTGIQTVHGVSVYTDWSAESIRRGFEEDAALFFVLTNSRSFSAEKTRDAHAEIAKNILEAAKKTGKKFIVVSRGDSTLRGHYPLETETIRANLESAGGMRADFEVVVPFFPEGNRFTVGDVHYIRQGNELVPAGETEFAKDKTFGYVSSNLKEWIDEKTVGRTKAGDVASISLESLRGLDYEGIERQLLSIQNFGKVIVNATTYADLEIFAVALLRAIKAGRYCILRSAASMVKVLGNVSDKPLLTAKDILRQESENGGIILVGSHVKKTSAQLEALKDCATIRFIEFNQHRVLEDNGLADEVRKTTAEAERLISSGNTVVVYTRRDRIDFTGNDPEKNLAMAVSISDAVTSVIGNLSVRPSFIIAKGGITSSDVGTKALRVRKALVLGQIAPGVPVWQTGSESKFPNMPYVIFPGNVGDDDTLRNVVTALGGA